MHFSIVMDSKLATMEIGGQQKFNITIPHWGNQFNITVPHWGNSLFAKPIYIELLALVGSIALLVLLILGFCRRRFSNTVFIKFPVMVGDSLSYALVSYTTGLMQSSTSGNELFVVWGLCLIILLASADSITAFSLQDSSNWPMLYMQLILQITWVFMLWLEYFKRSSPIEVPIVLLLISCAVKTGYRILTLRWVSGSTILSLRWNTKLVADYMHSEHKLNTGDPTDPVLMTGYNYVVFKMLKKTPKSEPPKYLIRVNPTDLDNIITLDTISRCQGRLLNSKQGDELKDICLSYALAQLLCRRFFGYELAEKDLPKTKALVFQGLLSQDDDDPERAFRVIEVELSFIYDFFYTKYPLISHSPFFIKTLAHLHAIPLLWLTVVLFRSFNNPNDYLSFASGQAKNYHALVTLVVVIIIFIYHYLQIFLYFVSDWVKMSLVCHYVFNPICQTNLVMENFTRFLCRLKIFKYYWQHKLGQYSLLDSLHYNPKINFIFYLIYFVVYNERQSQKQGSSIKLSHAVKKAILRSLRISNGQLSNGKASLERNGAAQLSEACNLGNHAQSILVWHIATTLCVQHTLIEQNKHKGKDDNNGGLGARCFWRHSIISRRHINESIGDDYEISISLSNYCAYLVAFAPKFLPDNSYDTEVMFDAVVQEANELLSDSKSMHQIYAKMMNMGEAADSRTIVVNGALLGKKLIQEIKDEKKRWKVLADYWAEIILFIAPSNNTMIHFEKLAEGGELITHLWALLTHAGIIEREAQPSTA